MLMFKPFTTLLNITLNKPTLCVKTSQICWCWALCRKPFVSEHAQCEGLRSPKGLPSCSDTDSWPVNAHWRLWRTPLVFYLRGIISGFDLQTTRVMIMIEMKGIRVVCHSPLNLVKNERLQKGSINGRWSSNNPHVYEIAPFLGKRVLSPWLRPPWFYIAPPWTLFSKSVANTTGPHKQHLTSIWDVEERKKKTFMSKGQIIAHLPSEQAVCSLIWQNSSPSSSCLPGT